jgi:serine/threonine protein kinase
LPPLEDPFGWIGQTLESKYAVEELVGEGGFAVVYRGHHKGFDDKVAIKCLKIPRKLEGPDREQFLQSFLAEGKLLHKLSKTDAGIVQALDVGAATSPNGSWTPFIVLEWLEGGTLEEELRKRRREGLPPRSLTDALKLLEPAARALGTAHALGIAHRDVKPANLFVVETQGSAKRTIKVVDFGIAKVLAESTDLVRAHEATGASIQAFTPRYAAPEQFDRRFGATGPWTDVFALALIVVEVVAGKSAMDGDTAQLFVASSNIQHRPTLAAHGINEGAGVEEVLKRALAVDTKERYQSTTEFWAALTEAAATGETALSVRAPDDTVKEAASTKREAPNALATRAPSTPSGTPSGATRASALAEVNAPPPGNRSVQLFAAGGITLVLCGVLYMLTHKEPERPMPVTVPVSASSAPPLVPVLTEPSILDAMASIDSTEKGFARWEDPTYAFGIDYPDELIADFSATDTKDGVVYVSVLKNAELRVFGGLLLNRTLDQMFDDATRVDPTDDIGKRWITSKNKGEFAFEVTGNEGTKMFYLKTIITVERGTWKYATMRFTFPVADRDRYEHKVTHMLKSFTFRATEAPPDSGPRDSGALAPHVHAH